MNQDCRTLVADKKKGINVVGGGAQGGGGQAAGAPQQPATQESPGGPKHVVSMVEVDNWIFAVTADKDQQVDEIERVMVDSGAACSVCPLGYVPDLPLVGRRAKGLRTATGAPIKHEGQKKVIYEDAIGNSVHVNFGRATG